MSSSNQHDGDSFGRFLLHAEQITREARFVLDSIPNVEFFAVERSLRHLRAAKQVLTETEDIWLVGEERTGLVNLVDSLINPLAEFLAAPPPASNAGVPVAASGGRGRPRFVLDLERAIDLHNLGNTWEDVATAMGVARITLYRHLDEAGLSTHRPLHSSVADSQLDELIAEFSLQHPFSGAQIALGHLEAQGIHLPIERVRESLGRVDPVGTFIRWHKTVKRRVYRIHGCIDGFSRLFIYLMCCNNKRSATVEAIFRRAVDQFGWPSRARGDFGTENNGVERQMIGHWGQTHMAYLRGRSLQNIRIERSWRDIRKDALQYFREIFQHLEESHLLDMENAIERVCLFLVYQPRIQAALDRARNAWNHHKIRTERNKTPIAIYELSREKAIRLGYWTGDPGDNIGEVSADYGVDGDGPQPPLDELASDPIAADYTEHTSSEAEQAAGIFVNDSSEVDEMRKTLGDFDLGAEDGNHGMDVYCQAVLLATSFSGLLALASGQKAMAFWLWYQGQSQARNLGLCWIWPGSRV
ncbi:Integrase catalytic domain-containing protein [Mycena indigotica]|uniref:Integrase catalytic domain-containing protein n=1 Tax=Mycena indigotica TaxID=2126181 RepID=A0A8H6T1Y1_9AGAR|nr:Integrase catalytic domain-containing protein [Mycena indigotica]KAF7310168.1 Integrase catalytic domain-containing protein [Mycena indigotica]